MKNFALLLSSLAVASSAFAAAPEVSSEPSRMSSVSVEPIQVSAQSAKYGKAVSSQSLLKSKKVAPLAPAKVEGLSVSYEEPEGLFCLGMPSDRKGAAFAMRKGPAYKDLTWTNTSVGATEFEWEMIADFQTGANAIYKTKDLVRSEIWCTEDGPILYGMDEAGNAMAYQFGADNISDMELTQSKVGYFFGGDCALDNTDFGQSTYMYGYRNNSFIGVDFMQYANESDDVDPNTHLDPVFTTPEPNGYGFVNPQFLGYANRFKAPAAPYMISKIWGWMPLTVKNATVVEMTLYPIGEDGQVDFEVVLASGTLSVAPGDDLPTLEFDLFSLDEDGLETDEPIVIDSAFLAVMSFNNQDIAQVYPVCGDGATFPANSQSSPYSSNGYMLIAEGEELYFIRPPYSFYTDNTRTELCAVTDFLWMVDATYPWTYAVDGVAEANVPVEGGVASFNISSYFGIQYFDYYLPEGCDWIDFETATIDTNQELQCQVLNLPVAALPAGVEGRSAVVLAEGPGTSIELTVNQGEGNAVSVVVSDKNVQYFDLQGRKVANPEKGLYIRKAGNKAEKVIL